MKETVVLVVGLVLAGLAAAVHVYIFVLESLRWTDPRTRKIFGTTVEQARASRSLAFNQGFYNLFLAVLVVVGIVAIATGAPVAGLALVMAGVGCMLAASLVLIFSSPDKARPAVIQGGPPALAIGALVLSVLIG